MEPYSPNLLEHHVSEDEGFESGYEAVAMMGVPHEVSIRGSDPNSAEGALNHLMNGLHAIGFSGRAAVEDTTYMGRVERYEVKLPA